MGRRELETVADLVVCTNPQFSSADERIVPPFETDVVRTRVPTPFALIDLELPIAFRRLRLRVPGQSSVDGACQPANEPSLGVAPALVTVGEGGVPVVGRVPRIEGMVRVVGRETDFAFLSVERVLGPESLPCLVGRVVATDQRRVLETGGVVSAEDETDDVGRRLASFRVAAERREAWVARRGPVRPTRAHSDLTPDPGRSEERDVDDSMAAGAGCPSPHASMSQPSTTCALESLPKK
jgi:hypothetical protein